MLQAVVEAGQLDVARALVESSTERGDVSPEAGSGGEAEVRGGRAREPANQEVRVNGACLCLGVFMSCNPNH